MEGGSLFNPGFLGASFLWWIGQIADDSTWRDNILPGKHENKDSIPGWGRRYKVRIIGLHDKEEETIPSDQLPWAQVMYPVTGGGGQTNAGATANLRQGNFVFGFFLDGQDQQVPVIMGVLGNNAQTALNTRFQNFGPTSGFVDGAEPKTGSAKERVPDEGLVTTKPKSQLISQQTATPPPGVKLNQFGLRPDIPLTREQLNVAQQARQTARDQGLPPEQVEAAAQQAVADLIKNDRQQANSKTAPSQPGATKENVDAVHQQSASDVKREDKMKEKISLLKPCDTAESAIKAIQTEIENVTKKIEKYLKAINSYVDAVSNTISNIQKVISDAACIIAKYMKILFDKIMEYVLKLLNKELTKVVSAMPSSMRQMFGDIKEILTELILCLYNKITNGLCGLIQDLLNKALKPKELEAIVRARQFDDQVTVPEIPVCAAEDFVGQAISASKEQINQANNTIIDNLNAFLDDIQGELAGVSGALSDITSLIGNISGALTAAFAFENLKLNIFGCELAPNCAVSDYYTFSSGGSSAPTKDKPSAKGVSDVAAKPTNAIAPAEVPYVGPTKNTQNLPTSGTSAQTRAAGAGTQAELNQINSSIA
jgi:hypothetical protein